MHSQGSADEAVTLGKKDCLLSKEITEPQTNIAHALQKLTTVQKATSGVIY